MTRRPLLASTLLLTAVTALTSGCATLGLEHPPTAAPATPTVERSSAKPSAPPASAGLTKAQAQAALITERDLGAPWTPTRGAATWRDGMLKATASPADVRQLMDRVEKQPDANLRVDLQAGSCEVEGFRCAVSIPADALHVSSTRVGTFAGTHTVGFDSESDVIELTHTARNRRGFARGAVLAARWLHGRKGVFTMDDVEF